MVSVEVDMCLEYCFGFEFNSAHDGGVNLDGVNSRVDFHFRDIRLDDRSVYP